VQEQTKTTGQPETLNGQQMSALHKQMAGTLADIKKDVELRKWAVDQACGIVGSETPPPDADVVHLARQIYAFLTEAVTISDK
jgi:hypothetical protein